MLITEEKKLNVGDIIYVDIEALFSYKVLNDTKSELLKEPFIVDEISIVTHRSFEGKSMDAYKYYIFCLTKSGYRSSISNSVIDTKGFIHKLTKEEIEKWISYLSPDIQVFIEKRQNKKDLVKDKRISKKSFVDEYIDGIPSSTIFNNVQFVQKAEGDIRPPEEEAPQIDAAPQDIEIIQDGFMEDQNNNSIVVNEGSYIIGFGSDFFMEIYTNPINEHKPLIHGNIRISNPGNYELSRIEINPITRVVLYNGIPIGII